MEQVPDVFVGSGTENVYLLTLIFSAGWGMSRTELGCVLCTAGWQFYM